MTDRRKWEPEDIIMLAFVVGLFTTMLATVIATAIGGSRP